MKGFNKIELFNLYNEAFKEGLKYVSENFKDAKPDPWEEKFHKSVKKIERHYWSGIPSSSEFGNKPVNYAHWLKENGEFLQFKSWKELREYVLNSESFKKYYQIREYSPYEHETRQKWEESFAIEYKIGEFIDHYIHKYRSKRFNQERFKKLFDNWFNSISKKKLSIEIWIPIIYTNFGVISFKISDTISIKKISEELQISRQLYSHNEVSLKGAKELLISSCSHAIVINGWYFEGELNQASLFPTFDKILEKEKFNTALNNIIGSIRIVTGKDIGYFQLFANPIEWSVGWIAKFETVITTYGDFYPPSYEDYKWNEVPDSIMKEDLRKIKKVFKSVSSINNKKLTFAINKLNSIITRKKSDDIVFDTTVALESLLCHDSQSEITYRLSTRGSYISILRKFNDFNPYEIKLLLSKLYSFRSAVAHGKERNVIEKLEQINIGRKNVHLLEFGVGFLRHSIEFILDNIEFADINKLDEKILMDAI